MLSLLEKIDRDEAIGILARAALSIENEGNPESFFRSKKEEKLRDALIAEIKRKFDIDNDDFSEESMSFVANVLDEESDRLLVQRDEGAVVSRLSEKGTLPSDLYEIFVVDNIKDFHKHKFERELSYIVNTVHHSDSEQHFVDDGINPPLVSLFSKKFEFKEVYKSFFMLVAGQRAGSRLDVHHAWRIYPDLIDVNSPKGLIGVLERFAGKFGVDIDVGGTRGKFIFVTDVADGKNDFEVKTTYESPVEHAFKTLKKYKPDVMITNFFSTSNVSGIRKASLSVGINLTKYEKLLKTRGY